MSMAQQQQLHELCKKAGLVKGQKNPESSKALETGVTMLETKKKTVAMRPYLQMKSPKLITEMIQLSTEKGPAPDRTMQVVDG